ncbi:MAG: response regulator [Myxococcota bacterium]
MDDDPTVRRALGRLCRSAGCRPVTAVNPADAMQKAPSAAATAATGPSFELAILDIDLGDPTRNGVDLGAWLIDGAYVNRVVFYSAQRDAAVYRRAMALGDYIEKGGGAEGSTRLLRILSQLPPRGTR